LFISKEFIKFLNKSKSVKTNEIDFLFYPMYSGAEVIESDVYKKDIFLNHKMQVYSIARYITPNGWRFSFPPKFLNEKTRNKDIFILDDGCVSGATISQMIDEICFLEVKSITILSIFGRLEDYQREFFSRIEKSKCKEFHNINTYKDIFRNELAYSCIFTGDEKSILSKD